MSLPSAVSSTAPVTARSRDWARVGLSVLAGVVAALSLVLAGPAGPAAAHSELVGSSPAAGARLSNPPTQVRMTFNQDVSTQFAKAAMTVEGGSSRRLTTRVEGRDVIADVPSELSDAQGSGTWQVAYRVVSADGHPISGTISFTVADPAREATGPAPTATASQVTTPPVTPTSSAATTAPPASAAAPGNAQPSSKSTVETMLWLALGALVLAVAVGAAVWRSQDKSAPGPGTRRGRQPPQA